MNVPQISFSAATQEDIEYLLWLRKATMDEYIIRAGLPATEEAHLARINYAFEHARIISVNGDRAGLIKIIEHADVTEIVQIQIDPALQGKGIGREILVSVIEHSAASGVPVILSVLKTNKAINLYSRLGFNTIEENDTSFIMKMET